MELKNDQYELNCLRYGEFCVLIEFCQNCEDHNNSLRHDPKKYQEKALYLKQQIQEEFPFLKIYLKPLQTEIKENIKKLGLFEVNFGSYDQKEWQLVGSKLITLKWPNKTIVLNNIRQKFQGKTLKINLNFENAQFHPNNNFKQKIRTLLVSYLDFPMILEKIKQHKKKKDDSKFQSANNFKRKLSSIVLKKLNSGEIGEVQLDDLLQNKQIVIEQIPDYELKTKFVNIKPGRYKFIVLSNKNLKFINYDVRVNPVVTDEELVQNHNFSLIFKNQAYLDLNLQYEQQTPIIKVSLKLKEAQNSQNDSSMMEEELFFKENIQKKKKQIAVFKSNELNPGIYNLIVEYRNRQTFRDDIYIFQGFNNYILKFPELVLNYNFKEDEQFLQNVVQKNEGKYIKQISEEILMNQNNKKQNKNQKQEYIDEFEDDFENEEKNEFQEDFDHPKSNTSSKKNKKEKIKNKSQKKDEDKENKVNSSFQTFNSKQSITSKQNDSNQKKSQQKNRIASGNRIRPGERLQSAKSTHMNQIQENEPKLEQYVQKYDFDNLQDGTWENLKKDKDSFSIYIQKNDIIELDHDFVGDQLMRDNVSSLIESFETENFFGIKIQYFQEFQIGRFFTKKNEQQQDQDVIVYISNNQKVYKILISKFYKNYNLETEKFLDICILCKNDNKKKFEEFINLVPLSQEISALTGLLDIKHLVSFVTHSKFNVWKFFGYEFEEEIDDQKDYILSETEAIENLKNYEILWEGNFLISSVRCDKSCNISFKKINQQFIQYQKILVLIDPLLEQIEQQIDEEENDLYDFDEEIY